MSLFLNFDLTRFVLESCRVKAREENKKKGKTRMSLDDAAARRCLYDLSEMGEGTECECLI